MRGVEADDEDGDHTWRIAWELTDRASRGSSREQGAGSRAGRAASQQHLQDPRVAAARLFSRRAGLVAARLKPLSSRHARCAGGAAMNADLQALAAMLHDVSQEAGSIARRLAPE